jgi:hypothetical protein
VRWVKPKPAPGTAGIHQSSLGADAAWMKQVVEMSMGEQDAVEPTEPEPTLKQLALGALAAVHQEPAVPMQHDERWQPSVDSRHGRSGAKENDLEQVPLTSGPPIVNTS